MWCLLFKFRDALLPYFNDIYLVPEHPALKNVSDVLCASNRVKKRYANLPGSQKIAYNILISLQERVRHILKGVRHERSDVRRDALKALYKLQIECRVSLLSDVWCFCLSCAVAFQNELEQCMVGSETIDPVITEIITTVRLCYIKRCTSIISVVKM